jgi:hypothetical protein
MGHVEIIRSFINGSTGLPLALAVFQVPDPIDNHYDTSDRASALHKASTYTQDNIIRNT